MTWRKPDASLWADPPLSPACHPGSAFAPAAHCTKLPASVPLGRAAASATSPERQWSVTSAADDSQSIEVRVDYAKSGREAGCCPTGVAATAGEALLGIHRFRPRINAAELQPCAFTPRGRGLLYARINDTNEDLPQILFAGQSFSQMIDLLERIVTLQLDLVEEDQGRAASLIKRLREAAKQRNDAVHAQWFRGGPRLEGIHLEREATQENLRRVRAGYRFDHKAVTPEALEDVGNSFQELIEDVEYFQANAVSKCPGDAFKRDVAQQALRVLQAYIVDSEPTAGI